MLYQRIEQDVARSIHRTEFNRMIGSLPEVGDAVKRVMQSLDRGDFVPRFVHGMRDRNSIYKNAVVRLGGPSTMSKPSLMAEMTNLLAVSQGQRVLELGTASGYQAAIIGELVGQSGEVHTVEYDRHLAKTAQERLSFLGRMNIVVHNGDGLKGDGEHAPFDGIIATAGAKMIPSALVDQLTEGGKIIIPVGPDPYHLKLTVGEKIDGGLRTRELSGVIFVPFRGDSAGAFSEEYLKAVFILKLKVLRERARDQRLSFNEYMSERAKRYHPAPSLNDSINYWRLSPEEYQSIDEGLIGLKK